MSLSLIAPALTGGRIDRADQVRVDPDRLAGYMNWKAKLLSLNGLEPEVSVEGRLVWHSLADAAPDSELIFLGLMDDKAHFAELKRSEPGSSLHYNPRVWQMLASLPADELALYGGARTLVDWHARHRFCSLCGAASTMSKGGWSRTARISSARVLPRASDRGSSTGPRRRTSLSMAARAASTLISFIRGPSRRSGRRTWREAGHPR